LRDYLHIYIVKEAALREAIGQLNFYKNQEIEARNRLSLLYKMKMNKKNENKRNIDNKERFLILDDNNLIENESDNEKNNENEKINRREIKNRNKEENENDLDITCIFCRENLSISQSSIDKEVNVKNMTNENVLISSKHNDNNLNTEINNAGNDNLNNNNNKNDNNNNNCNNNNNNNNNNDTSNDIDEIVKINMNNDENDLISNISLPQEPVVCLPCVHRYTCISLCMFTYKYIYTYILTYLYVILHIYSTRMYIFVSNISLPQEPVEPVVCLPCVHRYLCMYILMCIYTNIFKQIYIKMNICSFTCVQYAYLYM
jgi:hypothetical protein